MNKINKRQNQVLIWGPHLQLLFAKNSQLFAKIMISATHNYLSYSTGVEHRLNLLLLLVLV